MKEGHCDKELFELEQQPFQPLEAWQISICYFCFKFLEFDETEILELKDGRYQFVCQECSAKYVA